MKTSPLRQRMLDAMQMRGYSPRTHDSYVQAVLDLSHYYHRSPNTISADEVQQWLLWLLKERHVSLPCPNASNACLICCHGQRSANGWQHHDALCMYHACRNRHCPCCQQQASEQWQQWELADVVSALYCTWIAHELDKTPKRKYCLVCPV